jgi:tRNA-dihydrouridine synthase 1
MNSKEWRHHPKCRLFIRRPSLSFRRRIVLFSMMMTSMTRIQVFSQRCPRTVIAFSQSSTTTSSSSSRAGHSLSTKADHYHNRKKRSLHFSMNDNDYNNDNKRNPLEVTTTAMIPGRRENIPSTATAAATTTATTDTDTTPALYLPSHPNLPITNIMAPMVAASDYAFRSLCRDHGVQLTYTQMLHSKNFVLDGKFRQSHLDLWETGAQYYDLQQQQQQQFLHPSQIALLEGTNIDRNTNSHQFVLDDSSPLIVQLAGNDVNMAVQAALMLYEHTDGKLSGIDLNCGCPQAIAKKGMYGAFLMEQDPQTVYTILQSLRDHLPSTVAVSAKIRLPLDDNELQDRINRLVDTGIHFLTIHGRTVWENKTKVGACAVDRIQLAVDTVQNRIPVVANGGMEDYNDVQRIVQSTGAVAAMSSEALLERPDLFKKESLDALSPQHRFDHQVSFAKQYLSKCAIVPPVPGVLGNSGSMGIVRGHLFKFLHRYLQDQPDIRDRLAAANEGTVGDATTLHHARCLIEELEERYSTFTDIEWSSASSSSPDSSWYRRHRRPDRKVHQKEVVVLRRRGELYSSAGTSTSSDMTDSSSSMEDRKQQIKERIGKLKAQRSQRGAGAGTISVTTADDRSLNESKEQTVRCQ